jgi:two-component system CheB/CheR fusion protein
MQGGTEAYLELAHGQQCLNVLAMAREGLRFPLTSAMCQAIGCEDTVVLEPVRVQTNDRAIPVRVVVQHIAEPEALRGLLRVSFESLTDGSSSPRQRGCAPSAEESREMALERALQTAGDGLHKTRQELACPTRRSNCSPRNYTAPMRNYTAPTRNWHRHVKSCNPPTRNCRWSMPHCICGS